MTYIVHLYNVFVEQTSQDESIAICYLGGLDSPINVIISVYTAEAESLFAAFLHPDNCLPGGNAKTVVLRLDGTRTMLRPDSLRDDMLNNRVAVAAFPSALGALAYNPAETLNSFTALGSETLLKYQKVVSQERRI